MVLRKTGIIINDNLDMEGQYFLTMKLINKFMRHGRKTVMENILLQIRSHIKNK
jgi:ribosomal protein S7